MWGQAIVYIYQMGCDTPLALNSAYRNHQFLDSGGSKAGKVDVSSGKPRE